MSFFNKIIDDFKNKIYEEVRTKKEYLKVLHKSRDEIINFLIKLNEKHNNFNIYVQCTYIKYPREQEEFLSHQKLPFYGGQINDALSYLQSIDFFYQFNIFRCLHHGEDQIIIEVFPEERIPYMVKLTSRNYLARNENFPLVFMEASALRDIKNIEYVLDAYHKEDYEKLKNQARYGIFYIEHNKK